ncbi:MAG: hypothetical protein LGB01_06780 [Sulfurovum sp.]|nr:hypothetical protein [Sulfurovum sp.]
MVVSVSAAIKGKVDMAIGNIIGSNMANISVVLGSAALIKPLPIKSLHYIFDITVMGIATLLLVFLVANKLYTKSAGTILLIILGLFLEHIIQGF